MPGPLPGERVPPALTLTAALTLPEPTRLPPLTLTWPAVASVPSTWVVPLFWVYGPAVASVLPLPTVTRPEFRRPPGRVRLRPRRKRLPAGALTARLASASTLTARMLAPTPSSTRLAALVRKGAPDSRRVLLASARQVPPVRVPPARFSIAVACTAVVAPLMARRVPWLFRLATVRVRLPPGASEPTVPKLTTLTLAGPPQKASKPI